MKYDFQEKKDGEAEKNIAIGEKVCYNKFAYEKILSEE